MRVYSLVAEGKIPLGVEDVGRAWPAYRCHLCSGTSMGSPIYSGGHLKSSIPASPICSRSKMPIAPRAERIRSHVRARVELIGVASGLLRIARLPSTRPRDARRGNRQLALSIRCPNKEKRFAADLDQLTPIQAANLLAVIDATTSPEAFDVMSSAHCPVRSSDNYYLEHRSRSLDLTLDS